ncbi:hypothetical protein DSM3645_25664 [Blastopirellula marina DSM 3645]|uniref:Gfo/Idh/MocA-like oxidoreductase N-terminal domain-containing protein n=2 Tax=Blastopirellula marina TaxID=124 RepID=A4A2B9_9BACT|nr:hypothetical protein DSM3645_25664 [Blastopirellula marina DSM 3645]
MKGEAMRLGLLGCDEDALRLAQAAQRLGHQVVAAVDVQTCAAELASRFPQLRFYAGWEEYLGGVVDAAIVTRSSEPEQESALRAYVQEGLPLLLVHPACEMIFALELEMIRRDTGCVLVSCCPNLESEASFAIRQTAELPEELGAIDQIVIERQARDTSRAAILKSLASDIAWVVATFGEITSISATGPAATADDFSRLTVQMKTRAGQAIRWDLLRGDRSLEVTFLAEHDRPRWQLRAALTDADAEYALAELQKAIDGEPATFTWNEAAHALEASEAVLISLRRQRLIALRENEISEESTFKAMMATGGCLLLLATMGIAVVMVVWGVFIPNRADSWIGRNWPLGLLAVLAAFLGMQLLRLVFRSEAKPAEKLEK